MKRNLIFVLVTVLLSLVLWGCAEKGKDSLVKEKVQSQDLQGTGTKQYTVALVMKTLTNPFFVEMEKGARKAETEFGVKLLVKTGPKETSIEQQIQIVEELIVQKVDAIAIAPGSSTDLVKVLKKAKDAGIKIVNIDNRLDQKEMAKEGLKDVPFISVRNDEGAYLSVKELCKGVLENSEAIILEGISDAENAQLRKVGAEKAFKEFPNIRVVASETANWKIDEAHDVAKNLFYKYPKVTVVFCANDMMALGVVEYLKESERKDVIVAGFDNIEDVRKAISEGGIRVTIDQQADIQAYKGIEAAIKLIKGMKIDEETYVPVKVITKDSLSK